MIVPRRSPHPPPEEHVKRLLLCSGKVYYDLNKKRAEKGLQKDIAIVRLEQVRPFQCLQPSADGREWSVSKVYSAQKERCGLPCLDAAPAVLKRICCFSSTCIGRAGISSAWFFAAPAVK